LHSRLNDAIHQVQILLFVHVVDVRKCFQTRFVLQYLSRRLRLCAFARVIRGTPLATDREVGFALAHLDTCNDDQLEDVLVTLVWMALTLCVEEQQPLLSKLQPRRRQRLENVLAHGVSEALEHPGKAQDTLPSESWLMVLTMPSTTPSEHELTDLRRFRHTSRWTTTPADHARKCRAFNSKDKRKIDIIDWKKVIGARGAIV